MSDTLGNIQSDTRHYANDSALTIVSGQGLRVANLIYQGMLSEDYRLMLGGASFQIGRRWPEATQEDTSITTVAGTEQYTWPTTPVFKDGFYLEYLDASSNSEPRLPFDPVPNMFLWQQYDYNNNGTPRFWRLLDVSGVVKLALRYKPDTTGDIIRITGLVEVTEFTDTTSTTVFRHKGADRALAMLIAADYKSKRGKPDRAIQLAQEAMSLLPQYDYTPVLRPMSYIKPHGVF